MRAWSEVEHLSPWKRRGMRPSKEAQLPRPDSQGHATTDCEPVHRRHRRVTISHQGEADQAASAKAAVGKHWMTVRSTEWRLAPNSSSAKIGDLPPGRRVIQVPCAQLSVIERAWCPIEPRGFVSFEDLVSVPEAFSCYADSSLSRTAVTSDDSERADLAAREARLYLQEETVRLREQNIDLKEQKIAAQSEVDVLLATRREVAEEIDELRVLQASEHAELERCRHERRRLQEKLSRCSQVVARTVRAMDQLHSGDVATESADEEALIAEIVAVGEAVNASLEQINDDGDNGVPRCGHVAAPLAELAGDNGENLPEKRNVVKTSKSPPTQPRTPLKDVNAIR